METAVRIFAPHRGVKVEVDEFGYFEATVGDDVCRADSMKGIRGQINQALIKLSEEKVSIPVVTFRHDHYGNPNYRSSYTILWHSVDHNARSYNATDPYTGERTYGDGHVMRADTEVGQQVIALKSDLRKAYDHLTLLEKELDALKEVHGLCPPDTPDSSYEYFDRIAAQVWMLERLAGAT